MSTYASLLLIFFLNKIIKIIAIKLMILFNSREKATGGVLFHVSPPALQHRNFIEYGVPKFPACV